MIVVGHGGGGGFIVIPTVIAGGSVMLVSPIVEVVSIEGVEEETLTFRSFMVVGDSAS